MTIIIIIIIIMLIIITYAIGEEEGEKECKIRNKWNRALLWLRKITATKQFKADCPLTDKSIKILNTEVKKRTAWTRAEIREVIHSHAEHCTLTAGSADVQYKGFIVGDSITCVLYCNNRIAVTLYSVGTWFVSVWCIIVNTLRKCNDNNNYYDK